MQKIEYISCIYHRILFFQKKVRLDFTHYLIMKIHNKTKLRNIAINHSADINSTYFMKTYRKCANKLYSFLALDTT